MVTAEEKSAGAAEHGWDGVALGYETAAEHLADAVREQHAFSEHLENAIGVVRQVPEETSFGNVSERFAAASGELAHARAAGGAVLPSLDEARSQLAATAEEGLVVLLDDLIEEVHASVQAAVDIQSDVDDESATAKGSERATGSDGPGEDSVAPADPVRARIAELRRQGHAPQRHGHQVTDQQLSDRALWGIDPMTGTPTDGDHGGQHHYGRDATKFTSDEALVAAESFARSTQSFRDQENANKTSGETRIHIVEPLEKVFGPDYLDKVRGVRRGGTKAKPTGDPPGTMNPTATDFTDGTLLALFRKGPDGDYLLTTAYPRPKGS
jgi:hypothetical protein